MIKHQFLYTSQDPFVKISVHPTFVDEQFEPENNHYLWQYHVKIENVGEDVITLKRRHWEIIDGFGRIEYVEGDGVVGETPTILPREKFEYTSFVPLSSPSGMMLGWYDLLHDENGRIKAKIPTFSLDSPYGFTRTN